uniref:Uncharacterized protein n=1 Tax=Arundo donax TaxID=35708 RepID=A0A0A9HE34_ARUDO
MGVEPVTMEESRVTKASCSAFSP